MHLALRHALGFGCSAAFLATLGGTEVLGAVKLLFALREDKSGAAIAAGDLLIGHKKEVKENKYYRFLPGFSKPILPYERTLFAKGYVGIIEMQYFFPDLYVVEKTRKNIDSSNFHP